MKTQLTLSSAFIIMMSILGCGESSRNKNNNQQQPSTKNNDTAESNLMEEQQTVEQRIIEIKQWYAEVQNMGLKNCIVKKRVKMDGLESPASPFDQVVNTCKLSDEYELIKGKFSGHHWNYSVTIYKKNGLLFFVYAEGSAETTGWEERYYCDNNENVIRILRNESSQEDEVGKTTEVKPDPQKLKIQDNIQNYLKDIQFVLENNSAISTAELLQGKWQSVDDKSNYLQFEKNHRKEIAAGMNGWDDEIFVLSGSCVNPSDKDNGATQEKDRYISCVKSDLCWYIVSVAGDQLVLSYMGRGNTLKYKRVK